MLKAQLHVRLVHEVMEDTYRVVLTKRTPELVEGTVDSYRMVKHALLTMPLTKQEFLELRDKVGNLTLDCAEVQ